MLLDFIKLCQTLKKLCMFIWKYMSLSVLLNTVKHVFCINVCSFFLLHVYCVSIPLTLFVFKCVLMYLNHVPYATWFEWKNELWTLVSSYLSKILHIKICMSSISNNKWVNLYQICKLHDSWDRDSCVLVWPYWT